MRERVFRRTDLRGWVRKSEGYDGMGREVWSHVTGQDDETPDHMTYPTGYDERCGWCWLGAPHSVGEHARRVADYAARNEAS